MYAESSPGIGNLQWIVQTGTKDDELSRQAKRHHSDDGDWCPWSPWEREEAPGDSIGGKLMGL